MESNAILDAVARQGFTEPIEHTLQEGVRNAFAAGGPAGQTIEDTLHGTWLGHPLHPVLTDIPVGAWTVAVLLDGADVVSGKGKYADGADAAIAIGLAGALGAALTGVTDWHKTNGKARRIGLVHGLLNVGATTLFATSYLLRRNRRREAARACSLIGYLVAGASAYLGGELVYRLAVGVGNPTPSRESIP